MKFTSSAALLGLAPLTSASLLPSSLTKLLHPDSSKQTAQYVVLESGLSAMKQDPPSFVSKAESSPSGLTTDIVSLGSLTRMDYLTAQIETWASHKGVRHYWGFSELQDFDPECSAMSDEARVAAVDMCKANPALKDPKMKNFFANTYGISEGNRVRTGDAGWICAQRRVGRALGWLHSQYSGGKMDVPDYLMVVDDDTYVDLVDVMSYLEEETKKTEDVGAFARAGCVFEDNRVVPFPIAYGGFGTILNKAAITQLSEPIICSGDTRNESVCSQIKADKVGEASIFQDGMSIFELFYKYSALKDYCMHSDWLLGYIFEFYLSHPELQPGDHNLKGMKTFPDCGNITATTGEVRPCTQFSDTCHNQNPQDMEFFAISSYAQSPESYKALPKMELTNYEVAMLGLKEKEYDSAESVHLPNVMLIDSVSSDIAQFLSSNGACGPKDNVHFFDRVENYNKGIKFYAKSFEHCSADDLKVDATPETLMQAERVYELYNQVGSDLKIIAVVQESCPVEFGRYLDVFARMFSRQQVLVLSSFELEEFPQKSQWRIEQFLGRSFSGELQSVSALAMPSYSSQDLKDMHDEFYNFIDSKRGPWMEQHPFPRTASSKDFAFASILGWNPSEDQNKIYLDAIRVMMQSLKGTAADFVVLMMYEDEHAESLLVSEGAIVKHVAPLKYSLDTSYFEPWFVDIALAKLRAFEMTDYKRVQFLDVDASVTDAQKMFELFTSFPNVKLVSEGLGKESPLRAGWFMIEPSSEDFQAMEQILARGDFTVEHGWENLDLAVKYPGWTPSNPLNNWEFYGSQLEQGLLFHYFYALPKSINPSAQDSELLTLLDDDTLLSFGFIHFYGNRKPWAKDIDTSILPPHVELARNTWRKAYESLSRLLETHHESPRMLSPLTTFGFNQYTRASVLYNYYYYSFSPTASPSTSPTTSPSLPPSISPSVSPSSSPSISPSATPSASPSSSPSISPSVTPSMSPSASPSASPITGTVSPSMSPTGSPSTSPSKAPSAGPSSSPSMSPATSPTTSPSTSPSNSSASPSLSPSSSPSNSPSVSPSASPSSTPSNAPTITPTKAPTKSPTISPTKAPTKAPSASPTASPSDSPSAPPSKPPSASPTMSPTTSPTTSPTVSPSVTPSLSPTASPSATPSTSPSTSPSMVPSTTPSTSPSLSPTTTPTSSPSGSPSTSPSAGPSASPSASPSATPTAAPSVGPSVSPTVSNRPSSSLAPTTGTKSPSTSPSASPSSSPSVSPSNSPTQSPTKSPTKSPTNSPTHSPTKSPTNSPTKAPSPSPSVNNFVPTPMPTTCPKTTECGGPGDSICDPCGDVVSCVEDGDSGTGFKCLDSNCPQDGDACSGPGDLSCGSGVGCAVGNCVPTSGGFECIIEEDETDPPNSSPTPTPAACDKLTECSGPGDSVCALCGNVVSCVADDTGASGTGFKCLDANCPQDGEICSGPGDLFCSSGVGCTEGTCVPDPMFGYLCSIQEDVTSSPVAAPTTASPTKNPVAAPITASPTKNPVAAPITASPTKNPVAAPTTASPTKKPTKQPSSKSNKASKSTPKPITPAPITPKPVTPRPTTAKSQKAAKVVYS